MAHRIERVNNLIRSEVSQLLQRQVKDPRLGSFITVTEVSTSADLRYANLEGANLEDANLQGAHLDGVHIEGASYGWGVRWPKGFTPPPEAIKTWEEIPF